MTRIGGEQLPVPLGDDFDRVVDHFYGGLIVDRVCWHWYAGGRGVRKLGHSVGEVVEVVAG